jgi:prevent-host-death family protein
MTRLEISKARDNLADTINRVKYKGERIVLNRRGKAIAALVSLEDLALLEKLEDRLDLEDARKALEEPGTVPWKKVKADLGL